MSTSAPAATGKLVVIADDDAAMRELVAFALGVDGYRILAVETGRALVEQVRGILGRGEHGGSIDLIITDVRMPDLDGLKALRFLRDARVVVPVILMTAFSDRWTRTAARLYGAQLLDKPVELRRLRTVVRDLLAA